MNNRDTQFAGFAHLLWKEIAAKIEALDDECNRTEEVVDGCVMCNLKPERIAAAIEPIIAQRAYDLATHIYEHTLSANTPDPEVGLRYIPDLTQWPEE